MLSHEPFPRQVLTTSGVKDIYDVMPGDYVYEWKTSRKLEVKEIQFIKYHNMYEVEYSDGRIEYLGDPEFLYLDQWILPPHHPFCKCLRTRHFPIKLYALQFTDTEDISLPLDPDPYVAGALIIDGDLDQPYANYSSDRTEANNQFSHKYNIDYYPYAGNLKDYFQHKGIYTETPIRWDELFGDYDFHATNHNSDKIIPDEYYYTTFWNRIQFIRGAFDMCYHEDRSPKRVALYNENLDKLNAMQMMLASMGVSTTIHNDVDAKDHRIYRLDVEGPLFTWPGFFYHYYYIAHMLNNSAGYDVDRNKDYYSTVTVVDVRPLEYCSKYIRNPIPNIILESSHLVYTSPNYLPRVSI